MEHLSNHVIRENKRNGYKEMLNKAALDKSKEIAAEGIVSWSAANWMESEYPYLTRKEAEAIGKNLVKKASPFVAGGYYLYGTQENHERYKSPYNAFRADIYDTLPYHWYNWGMGGSALGGLCAVELYLLGASVRVKINKWKQQQSPLVDEEKTSGVGGENELLGK